MKLKKFNQEIRFAYKYEDKTYFFRADLWQIFDEANITVTSVVGDICEELYSEIVPAKEAIVFFENEDKVLEILKDLLNIEE